MNSNTTTFAVAPTQREQSVMRIRCDKQPHPPVFPQLKVTPTSTGNQRTRPQGPAISSMIAWGLSLDKRGTTEQSVAVGETTPVHCTGHKQGTAGGRQLAPNNNGRVSFHALLQTVPSQDKAQNKRSSMSRISLCSLEKEVDVGDRQAGREGGWEVLQLCFGHTLTVTE